MKVSLSTLSLLALTSAAQADYTLTTCGAYTQMGDPVGTGFYLKEGANSYTSLRHYESSEDELIDIEHFVTALPNGYIDIIRKTQWYDHRDRVESSEITAKIITTTGFQELTCTQEKI